jgi:catechol 2,3-dioxygenase-like lactoylglutathione lyase family enzyme
MKIPRMTVVTLGVSDLARSTAFYREIFSTPPITQYEGVTFFPLPGVWLSLYPLEKLAEDIGAEATLPAATHGHHAAPAHPPLVQGARSEASGAYVAGRRGSAHATAHCGHAGPAFRGVTLAYNARSRDEITAIFARAAAAGAHIAKAPQETFWGGYSGYFSDPDGHYWEVAWGPMFDFSEHGDLRFKT